MIRLGNWLAAVLIAFSAAAAVAQQQSVKPGINDSFRNPDVQQFAGRFEVESREVYARRAQIVEACQIKPGETVADIGAGTGLFTRLFSEAVGSEGRVIAVDIAQNFLDHIRQSSREAGLKNVETQLATADSTELPADSVDLAFICDTYHHFEFPQKTLASLYRAVKPGGRVVLIDFRRIEGTSSDWVLDHVRAGQEVFESEIAAAGFKKVREEPELLEENYLVVFEKPREPTAQAPALSYPIIAGYGGVVPKPQAVEAPRAGGKVLLDVTAGGPPAELNKGLDRAARLLNLYGTAGLQAADVRIVVVLHGEATSAALNDAAYQARFATEKNPNLPLVEALRAAGVEIFVCGQALAHQGFADGEVADGVQIAAAALTVLMNRQADGYAFVLVP